MPETPEAFPTITLTRSRLANAVRARDPEAARDRRRDLAAAKVAQFITRTLADAPPLTDDQRRHLASLLASAPR